MLRDDAPLVSANDHLVEPGDLFTTRLPVRMRADAPRLVPGEDGRPPSWIFGETSFSTGSHGPRDDRSEAMRAACTDPTARLRAMDIDGVDAHTIMPFMCGFAGERLLHVADVALRHSCVRAYNDYVTGEYCANAPDRLVPVAMVPFDDPPAAEAEVERAARLGARAVTFPHSPDGLGLPSFYTDAWERFLDAVAAAELPLFLHVSTGGRPWQAALRGTIGALLTEANFDAMQATVDLAFSEVLERHPSLQVVATEAGAGWLPYIEDRVDVFWARQQGMKGIPDPDAVPPSRALRRQLSTTLIDDRAAIAQHREIDPSRLLWQSDVPHEDSRWPDSRARLGELLADVDDDAATAIAGGNARRLLGLPLG